MGPREFIVSEKMARRRVRQMILQIAGSGRRTTTVTSSRSCGLAAPIARAPCIGARSLPV